MYVPASGREAVGGAQLGAHGRTARCWTLPLEWTTKAPQEVRMTTLHGRPRGALGSGPPQPPAPPAAVGPTAVSPRARSAIARRRTRWIRVATRRRSPTALRPRPARRARKRLPQARSAARARSIAAESLGQDLVHALGDVAANDALEKREGRARPATT